MDGSRKPSPQVLRRVRLSSKGCQRTPTLGTAAFVSLFSHSSYRTPAENSNEWQIARKCDMLSIGHWIIRNRLPDKLTRRGIEQRVGRVLNPLEPRNIDALEPRNLLDLAIHERSIVAPGSIKQLVAFYTNRETLGHVLVVDQAVAEIENARTSAA